jgi:hypothetical protein
MSVNDSRFLLKQNLRETYCPTLMKRVHMGELRTGGLCLTFPKLFVLLFVESTNFLLKMADIDSTD